MDRSPLKRSKELLVSTGRRKGERGREEEDVGRAGLIQRPVGPALAVGPAQPWPVGRVLAD